MKLLTRQHRSILLARVAALVLAGVCLVQLHLLQQRRWADVQLTDAEAEAGGSACCERPQARHQVAAVQGLVAQPTAAALVAAATAGVQGGTWLQIGANTMDAALNGNDPVIALLDGIPSWTKLFVEPIPPLFQRLERSVRRCERPPRMRVGAAGSGCAWWCPPARCAAHPCAAAVCLPPGGQTRQPSTWLSTPTPASPRQPPKCGASRRVLIRSGSAPTCHPGACTAGRPAALLPAGSRTWVAACRHPTHLPCAPPHAQPTAWLHPSCAG